MQLHRSVDCRYLHRLSRYHLDPHRCRRCRRRRRRRRTLLCRPIPNQRSRWGERRASSADWLLHRASCGVVEGLHRRRQYQQHRRRGGGRCRLLCPCLRVLQAFCRTTRATGRSDLFGPTDRPSRDGRTRRRAGSRTTSQLHNPLALRCTVGIALAFLASAGGRRQLFILVVSVLPAAAAACPSQETCRTPRPSSPLRNWRAYLPTPSAPNAAPRRSLVSAPSA